MLRLGLCRPDWALKPLDVVHSCSGAGHVVHCAGYSTYAEFAQQVHLVRLSLCDLTSTIAGQIHR